jgi:hypothetical protein
LPVNLDAFQFPKLPHRRCRVTQCALSLIDPLYLLHGGKAKCCFDDDIDLSPRELHTGILLRSTLGYGVAAIGECLPQRNQRTFLRTSRLGSGCGACFTLVYVGGTILSGPVAHVFHVPNSKADVISAAIGGATGFFHLRLRMQPIFRIKTS